MLAFYAAAIDPRIDAAMVSGYFRTRERIWEEPIYRNVWALLTEFGDAEIASLIAPRHLVIEACAVPEVAGPMPRRMKGVAAAPLPARSKLVLLPKCARSSSARGNITINLKSRTESRLSSARKAKVPVVPSRHLDYIYWGLGNRPRSASLA